MGGERKRKVATKKKLQGKVFKGILELENGRKVEMEIRGESSRIKPLPLKSNDALSKYLVIYNIYREKLSIKRYKGSKHVDLWIDGGVHPVRFRLNAELIRQLIRALRKALKDIEEKAVVEAFELSEEMRRKGR